MRSFSVCARARRPPPSTLASASSAAPGRAGAPSLARRPAPGRRPALSDDQRAEIREAFDLFDTQRTGKIDAHELKVCLRALGFAVAKEEVRRLVAEYDRAGEGRVDWDAFLEITTDKYLARDPEEEVRKAFALFDEDGAGKITLKAMRRVARELGEPLTDDELAAMIEEFDTDGDGMISEAEFHAIMTASSAF